MTMPSDIAFLLGANTFAYFLAAMFFFRGWRRTRDSLFLIFSAAFTLFAINEAATALQLLPPERQGLAFLFRLAGFTLLIVAIIAKNVSSNRTRPPA